MDDALPAEQRAGGGSDCPGWQDSIALAFGESDDALDEGPSGKPERCDGRRSSVHWQGERYHIHVDFYPSSAVVFQVWAYGPKYGTDRYWELQDLCRGLSKEFQNGLSAQDLAARVFRDDEGCPQSLTGAIADEILDVQTEYAQ